MRIRMFAAVATAGIAIVACGSSTETSTLEVSGSGGTIYFVVTGNSDDISAFQSGAASAAANGQASGANVTSASGDQHKGNQVCATDVTRNGDTLHVVVYSTISSVSNSICSDLQASGASST
jgi:hypothetical protein